MLKSLSGSAEDIFSEESSLKEKYYKVKPTMTEERQKTVDNLFEQLSPSLKKQGQLNDLKKLILKYSEEGANMEDIFSSIEDIFKSQLLGKNARPKMMQQDLQALIEGMENGLSDQKEGSLGSFLSNFIDDMLFMEDQLERSRKISAEYSAQIQLKEKSKMTPENKAELNTLRETNKLVEDISKENTLEYMNSKENFENKLYSAFKEQGINIENLFPEQQEIIDNLVDVISNKRVSGQEQYEKILAETIDRLKKVEVQVTEDLQEGQELKEELEGDFKGKSFNNVQQENETNVKTKTHSIGKIISLESTEKDVAALTSSLSALSNAGIATLGIINSLKDGTFEWSQALPAAGVTLTQMAMNLKNFGPGLEVVTKSMLKFAKANKNVFNLQTTKGIPAFAKATKTFLGTKVAIAGTTMAMGTLISVIGGGVLVIGLLVAAIIKWNNRQKDALEAAKKQTAALQENYNTLTAAADEFKQSISNYDQAIKALKNLKEGTDEYKDSLKKVNEQAKLLIENYGLWDKYSIKNGVITINVEELEKIQSQKDQQALAAESALYSAKVIQNVKQQDDDFNELRNKISFRNANGYGKTTITEDNLNQILNIIKEERSKYKADELFEKDGIFENFLQELAEINKENHRAYWTIKGFSDELTKNKKNIKKYLDDRKEEGESERYYANQLNISKIKSQYGEKITKLATNENGDVNEGRLNQIAQIINNSEIQRINREHIASETKIAGSTGKQWEAEFLQGNRNAEVQRLAEKYGYLDEGEFKKRFGRSLVDDKSDENLLKLYAEQIVGLSPEKVTNLTMSKGNLVDDQGQTIVAGSTAAERGLVRSQIYNLILKEYLEDVFSGEEDAEKQLAEQSA